jgi:hypothetical protein
MCQLITIKGVIKVFPKDRSRLKKKKKPNEEQTIVVNLSNDFSHYYAKFLHQELGLFLEPPPFGSHVTVNNGLEEIKDIHLHQEYLKSLHDKVITITYSPEIYRHWEFFAVKVYSKELNTIRKKLGLSPKSSFHITIGKLHPKSKKQSVLNRRIP